MFEVDSLLDLIFPIFIGLACLQVPLTIMAFVAKSILEEHGLQMSSHSGLSTFSGSGFWGEAERLNQTLNSKFIRYALLIRKVWIAAGVLLMLVLVLAINLS